jgi:hypothetical protein
VIHLDSRKGSNELDRLFGGRDVFKNPKPSALIQQVLPSAAAADSTFLDYFAGSGTNAHGVINLNRDDGGERRFILVEPGEYFDTVTLPRIQAILADPARLAQDELTLPLPPGIALPPGQAGDPAALWQTRVLLQDDPGHTDRPMNHLLSALPAGAPP